MGDTILIETTADEVVSIITQGPQGPSGSEAATLTTTGDLLYRDALANDRLPIGSEGQVLKVSSGLPAWGNESGAVTSVNGETGAVVLDAADVGAQSQLERSSVVVSADAVLSSNRNQQINLVVYGNVVANVTLPYENIQNGDLLTITTEFFGSPSITLRRAITTSPLSYEAIQILQTSGAKYQFIVNTATWVALTVTTHTHPASEITSGTLTHERGGLEADVSAYDGLLKISGGSTSAVTVTTAGEALLDDADAAAQRSTLGLGNSATLDTGTTAGTVAEGDHTHELNALDATGATDGHVLTADGAGGAAFEALPSTALNDLSNVSAAAPSDNDVLVYDNATSTWVAEAPAAGGVSAIGTSAADVFSVSGSDLVADDGGTVDDADPFIKWDDTAGKLVYANPLSRPSGAMYIGLAPTTTALGANATNVQSTRTFATQLASANASTAVGVATTASGSDSTAIGNSAIASGQRTAALGCFSNVSGAYSVCLGETSSSLRSEFATRPFKAVYWRGQTTNATPTILNLDGAATNRFAIAANTALAVDVLLVARRSDTADKWLVARRFLGIRRDGSNNTSLIGSVQTLGTDQSDGSPTWTFTLSADDVNECLQLEVEGAASETVEWRATAFYRVV